MQVVAQQRISGLLEPLIVGAGVMPVAVSVLFIQPIRWYTAFVGAYLVLFGAFWIVLGVKGWWPRGIGLAFSPDGISWHAPARLTLGSWMISWTWDDVLRAHYVTRGILRFAGNGSVILELRTGARSWPNAKWAKKASKRLEKQLGRPPSDNVVALQSAWWIWEPERVALWVNESVNEPECRAKWGPDCPTIAEVDC